MNIRVLALLVFCVSTIITFFLSIPLAEAQHRRPDVSEYTTISRQGPTRSRKLLAQESASTRKQEQENYTTVELADYVRTQKLANTEALFNIIANATSICWISFAGGIGLSGGILIAKSKVKAGIILCCCALPSLIAGLVAPALYNWIIQSAKDANLFS